MLADQEVLQLKGLKEMDFGRFEAQPEYLLPHHRPGANSYEDQLVPYGEKILERLVFEFATLLNLSRMKTLIQQCSWSVMGRLCGGFV